MPAAPGPAGAPVLRIVLLICLTTFMAGRAKAEGIHGNLELAVSVSDTETRAADGTTIRTEGTDLSQRYRLSLDRGLYPNLLISAGGTFEKLDSTVESEGTKGESTSTTLSPFARLTLGNPLYSAGVGYTRRDEKQESGASENRHARETYDASFTWRPAEFPTLDLRYVRTSTFDPARVREDTTDDTFQLSSRYSPTRPVMLNYQATVTWHEDRIGGIASKDINQSARVTYDDTFMKGRVYLHGNYDISVRNTETSVTHGGDVTVLVQPFAGLFALDDTPLDGQLPEVPALVNDNVTASAGIDIGIPPPGDPNAAVPRNLGLDFLLPNAQVNGLLVWVDRDLPASVAGSFVWVVYVSANNQDWTLWQTVPSAPFGPFVNRFEVRFPTVRTRYVKVTVLPLSNTVPGALPFDHIFVTELQATLTLPAEEVKGESSQTSHLLNLVSRARLLDDPSLYYNFSFLYNWTNPSAVSRMIVSNGLSLNKRLRPWLATAAQATWDIDHEPSSTVQSIRYGFSLSATPLRTLSHSLVYSGTTALLERGTAVRNSVFLSNRATLYQGISVFLNGGVSQASLETGERARNYLVNFSSDISPHPTLMLTLAGAADTSERSGGATPASTTSTLRSRVSVSWNPAPAVNVFGSTERVEQEQRTTTLYNLSFNWSPLRDGTLQMSFSAGETLRPEDNGVDRLIVPSLRWQVRPGVELDLSYAFIHSETTTLITDSRVLTSTLRAYF